MHEQHTLHSQPPVQSPHSLKKNLEIATPPPSPVKRHQADSPEQSVSDGTLVVEEVEYERNFRKRGRWSLGCIINDGATFRYVFP